jgi:hypothetical protein
VPKIMHPLALALLAAMPAMAQEAAPTEQQVEDTFTWSSVEAAPVLAMGEGQEISISEAYLVISSTDGPLAGLAGRCLVMTTTDLPTMGSRDVGTCVYMDANGDQLWESIEGGAESGEAAYVGSSTWTGGTGRFEGATGQAAYERSFSASPRAGVYQGTGTKRGSLTLAGS